MSILKYRYIICNKEKNKFIAENDGLCYITNDIEKCKMFDERYKATVYFSKHSEFCRKNYLIYIKLLQLLYLFPMAIPWME